MVRIRTIIAIFSLGSAVIGYLPLMPYLDMVAKYFFPLALAGGICLDRRGVSRSGWFLTGLSILFFLYYGARFSLSDLVQVTANLLVALLAVRLLSEKSGRNYLQIFALSLFCLAASSLYNLTGIFLAYLLLLLVLLAVSLVLLAFHVHDPEMTLDRRALRKVLGTSLLLPAATVPIMLLLFVVLPRTQYPIWNVDQGGRGTVGFTEKVTPGKTSSITAVQTPAFRVVCQKLPEDRLYWRGIVLNGFQGDSWVREGDPEEVPIPVKGGLSVEQTFYPEPSNSPYLLALNHPLSLSGVRRAAASDLVFTTSAPRSSRISYQAVSTPSDRIRLRGGIDRELYLELPAHLPPRLQKAARESAAGAPPEEIVSRMERFFRAQRLSYSTKELPTGTDPLDQFLFVKKKGNCEYYASSAALFLRLAGVPARLVGGYRGGVYSDNGGYYLVTEDMAHVWVEAYLEGKGWLTIDPSGWSLNFGGNVPRVGQMRLLVDTLGFYWNKAVVTYNLEKQINLFRGAGERLSSFSAPKVSVGQLLPVVLAPLGLFVLYRLLKELAKSPSQRLYRRFVRAVRRRYPELPTANRGIFELARSCADPSVREFATVYGSALYGDRSLTTDEVARLKRLLRALREGGGR
ncbi:DUF3488 and transglutaminase-like domain-containing protein [Geomonas sp. RF6]|uniref:transglutaminase family protein n=1 Tax=Geomonas sp. RF6 TaxID=2897342 RepID=UPI001E5FE14B|nr:DUF3488 and transglutaminase-like domain-containing protein [Geomonas sp. RF6]UFS70827.1 DUF3488 and transglutaminase-like domain-containing protein [Geomonas sp. RF6]